MREKKIYRTALIIFLFISIVILTATILIETNKEKETYGIEDWLYSGTSQMLKEQIKYPDTLYINSFYFFEESRKDANIIYSCLGTFSAENDFGSIVKSSYICKIKYNSIRDKYTRYSLIINGEKIY